ncbi:hypothetical protein B7R54_05275 [Subtercola boreus]|uniref:Rhodanese domain-containing protein n=1 Tax=Subtercola boreus TaxID=120213 RepID=A0A3E0VFL2_9MICO|nr:ThiF family adenylyltransferase [Subtercola boreus]RFA08702.1 hypothetical protein B7R54_05275 [Subtercola boreus]TQL54346.1 adenylyltransferase/sulfurtransferase [Subtercola boreus]
MARTPLVSLGSELDEQELRRYSRQLRMPQLGLEGQRRLKAARVLVLGAGGLGSPVLLYLAGAGVGTLGIVDDDTVDESNLQRQIIHTSDALGTSKARSARAALTALNPLVRVDLHEVRLDAGNAAEIFGGYDLVIDGTDNFATRYLANDTAAALGMPYVWGSVLRFDGQVSTFWHRPAASGSGEPGRGLTLRDLFPQEIVDDEAESCSVAGVLGPLCGTVGSAMATEALKLIVGFGEPLVGRILVIDTLEGSYTEVPFGVAEPGTAESATAEPAPTEPATAEPAAVTEPAATEPTRTARPATSLGVTELAARLAARASGADDFILLDVREPWERDFAGIDGSVLVPLQSLLSAAAEEVLPKSAEILVHCHHDTRSQYAREVMLQSGWQQVTFVEGGIDAWSAKVDPEVARY